VAVSVTAWLVCPIAKEPKLLFALNCAVWAPAYNGCAQNIANPTNSFANIFRAFSIGISSSGQDFPFFRFTQAAESQ
jgi:hypothetical protein